MQPGSYKRTHNWTKWWRPPEFGWRYFNFLMIGLGLVVGIGLWLMPNKWAEPEIAAKFGELGTAPSAAADGTPAALKTRLETEIARWQPVIEAAGVYAD